MEITCWQTYVRGQIVVVNSTGLRNCCDVNGVEVQGRGSRQLSTQNRNVTTTTTYAPFYGNSYTEREGDIEAYKNLCLFWRQSSLRNWKLILVISIVSSYTQSIGISSFSPTPMRSPCWNLIYLFLQCFLVMISHLFIVFFAYWVDFVPGGYLYMRLIAAA